MTAQVPGGILRVASRIATTVISTICVVAMVWVVGSIVAGPDSVALAATSEANGSSAIPTINELESYQWDFGRESDANFDGWPDQWQRYRGTGFPAYVKVGIVAHDSEQEQQVRTLDTNVVRVWQSLRKSIPSLPTLPPSIADVVVDRYLRVDLDGGQVKLQSPSIEASRMYQYRFSCRIMTQGLRHTSARAEFVFSNSAGKEIAVHSTPSIGGTTRWKPISLELIRPPIGAATMMVRLIVERSEDGQEDIRGAIGFDDLRIDQYPQLRITTDEPLGVYVYGRPINATAQIMGLPVGASRVKFHLRDSHDREVASELLAVEEQVASVGEGLDGSDDVVGSRVTWTLPRLGPGFYRIGASLEGQRVSTLSTETTVAVIDQLIDGPPHGSFGWTDLAGNGEIPPREYAQWLANLGVAWLKYPSWLAPDDTENAEMIASVFSKLQDAGIQTVGMLDVPPEDQVPMYSLRGRRDMVAAQLFRDVGTWQPLLEPVMSRLTLKVRMWQLGADRDHSFMGRPRLRDSITKISTGLQGFGQPIDLTISWPWMEQELPTSESSWQAVCRSSDPPLNAQELDAFLSLKSNNSRGDGPRTWLLLDPVPESQYSREARIRDLVLRMATVRSHRVQAAFVSNPRDPEKGLLKPNGRPDELLLPWRTTSRLIGNLRKVGSLQLRSGAQNVVFAGRDRAVLMVWSAEPTEEKIYLGEDAQVIDVWGEVTRLRTEPDPRQPHQRIKIGRVPTFIVGADPTLLAFRMSVDIEQDQLDSFLGKVQKLSVSFSNPTRDSVIGEMRLIPPETWMINSPERGWEVLAGRSASETFDVVLSNTAKVGEYEVPIQFEIETVPPKTITVYRKVNIGPEGLDLNVTTRLVRGNKMGVQIEFTNRSSRTQSYDCMLFPPPGRQYQRKFLTIEPGKTISRVIFWDNGRELVGQRMLLRAVEQDGPRVLNYSIDVTR